MGAGMRFNDWDLRLNDFLMTPRQFDWAECNCALFAADAVEAMTGVDHAKDFRGLPDMAAMLRAIKKLTGKPFLGDALVEAVTLKMGAPIAPLLARRGDVVAGDSGNGVALGICIGAHVAFIGSKGIVKVRLADCIKAWRVE